MPGKWGLHTFYRNDPQIAQLLPTTCLLKRSSLSAMMKRYGSVYIKPNMEHMGKGIMKAWKTSSGYSLVLVKGRARSFPSLESLTDSVLRQTNGKPYIVQQTINLAKVNGLPFDVRVMMMRDKKRKWRYSGMLAKVAGPSSIITNVARGRGSVLTLSEAIRRAAIAGNVSAAALQNKLIQVSGAICRRFNRYKYSSQIGIDFGIDRSGRLWLIEVNFDYPSHALFARLPDKTMYRHIKRRRREYLQSR